VANIEKKENTQQTTICCDHILKSGLKVRTN